MDQQPRKTGLLSLIRETQGSQFVIPVYQRNYTWTASKDVKQYLDDLKAVLMGEYSHHFMGIIIYLERSIAYNYRELSIIDGQQRLTTTFLLLYAIRKFFKQNGDDDDVDSLDKQYLTNLSAKDYYKYKLKPLVADDDVYRHIVEETLDEIEYSDSNVLKNYLYIQKYLEGLFREEYTANDVLMALDRLYVVCIPIDEKDNAQKIFESINATGVKLTAADLIRNFLLMDLPSEKQEEYYAKYWKKLEENVSPVSKELELFFRIYLAIKEYEWVSKSNIYREFVDWKHKSDMEIEELFQELLWYAKIYFTLIHENLAKVNSQIRDAIEDSRKIRTDIMLPIMMEFYGLYTKEQISADVLDQLYWSINSYMIRRSLCDIGTQNISKLFPTALKKVLENCNGCYDNVVQSLNQAIVGDNVGTSGSYMPTDKQMMTLLENANVYKRPALRIVLDRIELYNNPAPVDLEELSIEHLMPQTPTQEWLNEMGADMETYMEHLHRIGNLTLASQSDNSRMGNLGWKYKNEILKDTAHLTLNKDIVAVGKWSFEEIDRRTKKLINKICEIYPYPKVQAIKSDDRELIGQTEALNRCVRAIIPKDTTICIVPRRVYKANDSSCGYALVASKMYPQGENEKYWFAYRNSWFEDIEDCAEQYFILCCRSQECFAVKLPRDYIKNHLQNLNPSTDSDGNITHYHIVIFKESDARVTMQLSKPDLMEVDISEYVCEI